MYRRGIRVAGFTWNFENELGFGHKYVTDPATGKNVWNWIRKTDVTYSHHLMLRI